MAGRPRKPKEETLPPPAPKPTPSREQVITEAFAEQGDSVMIIRQVQVFDEEISSETVQRLINELNNHLLIDLWFSTPGGSISAMNALLHYLNSRSGEIKLYLCDEICSAGTFLLTDYTGEIVLTDTLDFILFHLADRLAYTRRKDKLDGKKLGKQLDALNEKQALKFRNLGLTEGEISKYMDGKDVILYRKDFPRLNINHGQK